jgi:hypothetical protein
MNRRAYLAACSSVAAALAGCVGGGDGSTGTGTPSGSPSSTPTAGGDGTLPIDPATLDRPLPKDAIQAVVDPAFGDDWSGVEMTVSGTYGRRTITPRLEPDDRVVGVARDGVARAYPLRVLNWHEVVNDVLPASGTPLLVAYCPLCAVGVAAARRVDGEATRFGVSGYLYRSALVMYDEASGSLWSQLTARAIHGPRTGERLDLLPASLPTWSDWREAHPDTVVLRPPPESGTVGRTRPRNYDRDPYVAYSREDAAGFDGEFDDERLHPKARVVGVANGDVARAYPFEAVRSAGVVDDEVGGLPVAVGATAGGTMAAFVRRVGGERVSVAVADDRHLRAAGSRWRISTGRAVDGPHEGDRLTRANELSPMYWFAWLDLHPESEVYGA